MYSHRTDRIERKNLIARILSGDRMSGISHPRSRSILRYLSADEIIADVVIIDDDWNDDNPPKTGPDTIIYCRTEYWAMHFASTFATIWCDENTKRTRELQNVTWTRADPSGLWRYYMMAVLGDAFHRHTSVILVEALAKIEPIKRVVQIPPGCTQILTMQRVGENLVLTFK